MKIFTVAFLSDAAERAVKTAAQFVIGGIGLSQSGPVNAFDYDLALAGKFALSGFALSMLFSIVSAPIGVPGTASVLPSPPAPPPPPE
jgi:hypothetical protein